MDLRIVFTELPDFVYLETSDDVGRIQEFQKVASVKFAVHLVPNCELLVNSVSCVRNAK